MDRKGGMKKGQRKERGEGTRVRKWNNSGSWKSRKVERGNGGQKMKIVDGKKMKHTTIALTTSPGLKLSAIFTLSFSVARTSCTLTTPCHSPSPTVSPTTKIATLACLAVILVTRHSTILPTSGMASRFAACASPGLVSRAGLRSTEMVGSGVGAAGVILVRRF